MSINNVKNMTLLDWFAGQALAGLIVSFPNSMNEEHAGDAYGIAYAMMKKKKEFDDARVVEDL